MSFQCQTLCLQDLCLSDGHSNQKDKDLRMCLEISEFETLARSCALRKKRIESTCAYTEPTTWYQ